MNSHDQRMNSSDIIQNERYSDPYTNFSELDDTRDRDNRVNLDRIHKDFLFHTNLKTGGGGEIKSEDVDINLNKIKLECSSGTNSERNLAPNCNKKRPLFKCPYCIKTFTNSSAIAKHKLTHSDERRYTCDQCGKAFKRQDHLNGHKNTHKSRKPHGCQLCDKSYSDARSLRRHYENQHQEECRKKRSEILSTDESVVGNDNSDLLDHFLSSTTTENGSRGGLSVNCSVCHKKFRSQAALNGHMRLHGGYGVGENSIRGPGEAKQKQEKQIQAAQNSQNNTGGIHESGSGKMFSPLNLSANQQEPHKSVHNNSLSGLGLEDVTNLVSMHNPSMSASSHTQHMPSLHMNHRAGGSNIVVSRENSLPVLSPAVTHELMIDSASSATIDTVRASNSGGTSNIMDELRSDNYLDSNHQSCYNIEDDSNTNSIPGIISTQPWKMNFMDTPNHHHQNHQQQHQMDMDHSMRKMHSQLSAQTHNKDPPFLFMNSAHHNSCQPMSNTTTNMTSSSSSSSSALQDILTNIDAANINSTMASNTAITNTTAKPHHFDNDSDDDDDEDESFEEEDDDEDEPFPTNVTSHHNNENHNSMLHQPTINNTNNNSQSAVTSTISAPDCTQMISKQSPESSMNNVAPQNLPPKKKTRPAPIFIPPQTSAHMSRLRSPRVWTTHDMLSSSFPSGNPTSTSGGLAASLPGNLSGTNAAPPPYTPPPMLSPQRRGSGLFNSIFTSSIFRSFYNHCFAAPPPPSLTQFQIPSSLSTSSPVSTAINTQFGFNNLSHVVPSSDNATTQYPPSTLLTNHQSSMAHQQLEPTRLPTPQPQLPLTAPKPISTQSMAPPTMPPISEPQHFIYQEDMEIGVAQSTMEDPTSDGLPTSAEPRINIGTAYQVEIPTTYRNKRLARFDYRDRNFDTLLWHPKHLKETGDNLSTLDLLMKIASSPAVKSCGLNMEYTFHLLCKHKGDIEKTLQSLLEDSFVVYNYVYAETTNWTTEEIVEFQERLKEHDRDFKRVSVDLQKAGMDKSVKACVEFYYVWKQMNNSRDTVVYRTNNSSKSRKSKNNPKPIATNIDDASKSGHITQEEVLRHDTTAGVVSDSVSNGVGNGYNLRKKFTSYESGNVLQQQYFSYSDDITGGEEDCYADNYQPHDSQPHFSHLASFNFDESDSHPNSEYGNQGNSNRYDDMDDSDEYNSQQSNSARGHHGNNIIKRSRNGSIKYCCKYCRKSFVKQRTLDKHIRANHE